MASQVRVPQPSSPSTRECQKSIAITADQVSTVFFCSGRCSGSQVKVTSMGDQNVPWGRDAVLWKSRDWRKL